jgi:2-polyprenyl-3-methyl-5-hydroxy-6-metoxy-1,4-benzoquinol methylase
MKGDSHDDPRDPNEDKILRSWQVNASPWSRAIRSAGIASRELVTNAAILAAIASVSITLDAANRAPLRVLDVGCGEGWLARALGKQGMRVTGIDAVPELVAAAQKSGGGDFQVLDYSVIARRQWKSGPFDVAVCNFSLLGADSVDAVLAGLNSYVPNPGFLVVQTLHPAAACGDAPYRDGWRPGNWCGFSGEFSDPAPWYFRTIQTWQALLTRSGFDLFECREPKAALATEPSSIIWICKARATAQT